MALEKHYIVIEHKTKPIFTAEIKSGTSEEYLKLKDEAEKNLLKLYSVYDITIKNLIEKIENLEKEIKHLRGED